jgi:hypothetical protein
MEVVIPSSGRANKQITRRYFPDAHIIVPENEVVDYSIHANVVGVPVKGIGATRQWIIENYGPKVLMLDDDLTFFARRLDDRTKFRDLVPGDLQSMLNYVEYMLDEHPHVSIATREGGNRNIDEFQFHTRTLRALAYHTPTLHKHGVRFDRMPVMEDFDVSLQLLTKGHGNCVINMWVQNQHGSQTEGGCSQYRTMEVQAKAAEALAEEWPEYVTVVEKTTKTAWGGGTRKDVRIQWKKALADGTARSREDDVG